MGRQEHQVKPPAILYDVTQQVVDLLSDGKYGELLSRCSESRITEAEIKEAIRLDEPDPLVRPPGSAYREFMHVYEITGTSKWTVEMSLWTESRESDLTLALTIDIGARPPSVELLSLHVM